MSLKKYLRDQAYDIIEGPVRNHKLLQLWIKNDFNEIELYYDHVDHAFRSDVPLHEIINDALTVNTAKKDHYGFNIGITLLEEILQSMGLGNLDLSARIESGKKVTISYDNSMTRECPTGEIENYFSNADFRHRNPALLKNANRDNIIILTGIVFAKNLVVDIETDFQVTAGLIIALNEMAEGKLDFSGKGDTSLRMISGGTGFFPVAVKASRVVFDKGVFKKLILVTDNRNFF